MKRCMVIGLALSLTVSAAFGAAKDFELKDVVSLGDLMDYGGTVYFDFNASKISEADARVLHEAAEALAKNPKATLHLEGHTDNRGSDAYNMALSKRRANAVRQILIGQYGADGKRITTSGRGEEMPVESNETDMGRAKNRRVELKLTNPGTPNVGTSIPAPKTRTIKNAGPGKPNTGTGYPAEVAPMTDQGTKRPNTGNAIPGPSDVARNETRGNF